MGRLRKKKSSAAVRFVFAFGAGLDMIKSVRRYALRGRRGEPRR